MKIEVFLRWSDVDRFGHVNNAVMATIFEEARARFFYSDPTGTNLLDKGVVVASQSLDYKKPIFYSTEPLTVDVNVTQIGNSSFELGYSVAQSGQPNLASGVSTMVVVDEQSAKPKRLSEEQINWLSNYQ
ncbi:MAG TPA: thioesterase family protein [Microbacteriaceae bacterium]